MNFEHRGAAHCETGVTSNMLNYYGYQLSEPMVFGIGAGLSFIYVPFVPFKGNAAKFSFRTMPGAIFKRAMKNLHIKIGMKQFYDKEKAMSEMDKLLAEGIPVGNVVGLYHLPYSPIRAHFNAHNLCVVGKEGDDYIVSDPCWHTTLLKLSYIDLNRVRFSEGAFKPHGKMYWIKEKPTLSHLQNAIVIGIKTTCKNMVGFPVSMIGVKGIVKLSKKVSNLEAKYGEKDASLYLAALIQAAEEIGTGGAAFRFLYGAFLFEAADFLNKHQLKDFAIEMNDIGDLWRNFAIECGRKIKKRTNESYNDLANRLLKIAEKEKKFFMRLNKFVKTECKI